MHQHTHRFGRVNVSEKESRLLFGFNEGPRSPGNVPDPHEQAWQEQVRMHKGEPGGDALLKIYKDKMKKGERYPWLRSAPDFAAASHELRLRASGAVRDPNMPNAWSHTPADKEADLQRRVDARLRQQYQENATQRGYDRQLAEGTPPWQTDFFKSHPFDARVKIVQHWTSIYKVPVGILEQYGLDKTRGVTYVSTSVPVGPASAPVAPAAPVVMPGASFRPRNPGQPTYATAAAPGRFVDYGAGLPDKVLPMRAGIVPKKPSAFHMYDVYTGGWKLDRNKVQSTNALAEYETRSQEFRATVDAADDRFNTVLQSLEQKIASSSGPEREAYLAVFNNYVARRAADAERLVGQAQRLSDDVQKGVSDPRNMQAVNAYPRDVQHYFAWQMYLAQNAPQAIDALAQQCSADILNVDIAIFQETQRLFDVYAKSYEPAKEMLNGDEPFETKKEYVLKAVAAMNEFGSHLFRNCRGLTVPDNVRQAYHDAALKTATAIYGSEKNDEIVKLQVPADEEGVRKLLAMRSDLLHALAHGGEEELDDLQVLQSHLNASRAEKRYLAERDPGSDRADTLEEREDETLHRMQQVLHERTDELDGDVDLTPEEAIALLDAAQKELYFLQEHFPDDTRVDYLHNRSDDPEEMGLIQRVLDIQHSAFKEKTDARLTELLTDPAAIRAALQDLRAEGRFLFRHRGTMTPAMEARIDELVGAQGQLSVNLATEQLKRVNRDDPAALGQTVTALARELAILESHAANKDAAGQVRALLTSKAMDIRGPVNVAIDAARNAKDADPRARAAVVDKALQAINAEIDALTVLKLDPERIANLRAETSLLDTRVAIRAEAEQALSVGPKQSADIESFRRVFGLLESEDEAIRMAYAKNPEAMQQKLDALAQRKVAFKNTIDSALAASLQRVGAATTVAEVDRASALLRASLQLQLGAIDPNASIMDLAKRLPKPADFSAAKAAYEKIEGARQAATERQAEADQLAAKVRKGTESPVPTASPTLTRGVAPQRSAQPPTTPAPTVTVPEAATSPAEIPPVNIRRATSPAEPAADAVAPATETPKAPNGDVAPATPGPAPALSPVVSPEGPPRVPANGPEPINAAERAKDEAPIRQADALLAEAETSLAAGNAGTIEELDRRITSLRQASETMDAWRERFATEQKQMYVDKADAWKVRFFETEDKLMAALGKSLASLGDPVSMERAATLLDMRFRQLQVEDDARIDDFQNRGDAPSRDITAARQRLWDDLNGTPDSLLPKAIAIDMPAAVIDRLQAIAKQLAADPSIIRNG